VGKPKYTCCVHRYSTDDAAQMRAHLDTDSAAMIAATDDEPWYSPRNADRLREQQAADLRIALATTDSGLIARLQRR